MLSIGEEGSGRNHSISSGVLIYEALIPLYEFGMALYTVFDLVHKTSYSFNI
jgi:hypothetical protein